jgi:hypothetical protein
MTDVRIARLSAAASSEDQARVRRLLCGLADRRLGEAITAAGLPPGEWCVRRMDVPVRLDPGRTDAAMQSAWAEDVAAALSDLLRHSPPGEQVVHYPRPVDALADLLGTLAAGRPGRAWAWRQLGLLAPGDPDQHAAPRGAALAALRRRPAEAIPALAAAARLAGVDALHRLFGSAGWAELARLIVALHRTDEGLAVPRTAGRRPASPPGTGPLRVDEDAQPGRTRPAAGGDGQQPVGSEVPSRLASSIQGRSPLASAFARARIRPDAATAWAWAVLAAADAEPALFGRPAARSTLAALAQGFGGTTTPAGPPSRAAAGSTAVQGTAAPRQIAGDEAGSAAGSTPAAAGAGAGAAAGEAAAGAHARTAAGEAPAGGTAADGPSTGDLPGTGPPAWPTDWAGLLFFLATAAEAGLPEAVLSDEVLADQPLSWTFYQLARRLIPAAGPTDPALFALAGLVPGDEPQQPLAAEAAHLDMHAGGWARVTAARLGQAERDAFDVAGEVAPRTGSIVASPGWIEVHLDLADVDIDVRRAGLDLDPGWVPWLGVVVIFVYA